MSEDSRIQEKFSDAIKYVLQPPKESNFLIINRTADELAKIAEDAALGLGLNVETFELNSNKPYDSLPGKLKQELLSLKYPRALGMFSYSNMETCRQETPARVELINDVIKSIPIGYLHSPGIDRDMALNGAVQCNYREMSIEAERMLKTLDNTRSMHITAPGGTNLSVVLPPDLEWQTDCTVVPPGPSGEIGRMGNLPVGECFIEKRKKVDVGGKKVEYPIKLIADGRIVCDVCASGIGKLVDTKRPAEIQLRDGIVTYFHSNDKSFDPIFDEWMKRELEYKLPTILEEVGIGLNEKARRTPNLLESEKLNGTVHFAPAHIRSHTDFVVDKPTITLVQKNGKQKTFMRDGKLF
jgi:leucyl aminopeptidase (aminopeptidase T)